MGYHYQYPYPSASEPTKPKKKKEAREKKKKSIKRPSKLRRFGKLVLLFIAVFIILYLVLNGPALWAKLRYYYQTNLKGEDYTEYHPSEIGVSNLPSPYTTGGPGNEMPLTEEPGQSGNGSNASNGNSTDSDQSVSVANNSLYVPKLDIRAPIRWNIPANQAMGQLRYGVVHIKPTARPGQAGGNVFITGHSSYYYWDPGKYKHIFALLPQTKKGNKIFIRSHGQLFKYQVYQTMVVIPTNTNVMKPVNKSIVSLMTCVPIGTSLRRFIVRAEQISPRPSAEPREAPPEQEDIPGDLLPGIFH